MLPDSTMCLIWRRVLAIFIVACVTTCAHARYHVLSDVHMTLVPCSPIGVALSIFLGFRNNASYDRFWEARKLWGQIVNARRTITRQILVFVGPVEGSEEEREHHSAPLPSLPAYRVAASVLKTPPSPTATACSCIASLGFTTLCSPSD